MTCLASLRSPQLRGRVCTLVIPLGSTEQHGPHLPLDTDTRVAVTLAAAAAGQVEGVLVAPAMAIGAAGEHAGFPGTLSIGTDVLGDAIVEIVRTAGPEFERIVVVNGHGGNIDAVRRAAKRCAYEGRPIDAWHAHLADGDSHAGRSETSVMLAIAPEVVRMDLAEAGQKRPLRELLRELRSGGMAAVSENGVLGDPTGADRQRGREIFDGWVAEIVALLRR